MKLFNNRSNRRTISSRKAEVRRKISEFAMTKKEFTMIELYNGVGGFDHMEGETKKEQARLTIWGCCQDMVFDGELTKASPKTYRRSR